MKSAVTRKKRTVKMQETISEKSLDQLIRGELSKGRTIIEIKTSLITLGYQEDLVDKRTNAYFIKNYLVKSMFVLFILSSTCALLFFKSATTGYVSKEISPDTLGIQETVDCPSCQNTSNPIPEHIVSLYIIILAIIGIYCCTMIHNKLRK